MGLLLIAVAIVTIVLCVLLVTFELWFSWFLQELARYNLFVTVVEENSGKMIMKFGRAWRFITSTAERDPDPEKGWNIEKPIGDGPLKNVDGEESPLVEFIDRSLLPGGMRWIGWPFIYSVHRYNFRWSVLRESLPLETEDGLVNSRQLPSNGKYVAAFAKRIDYIYLRDAVYYFELIGAETKASSQGDASPSMPVNIHALSTVRIVNPYRALFHVHDWLESTLDLIRPSIRSEVSKMSYQDILGKPEVAERAYDMFLKKTGLPDNVTIPEGENRPKNFADYIEHTYGARYKRIAFEDIVPPEVYQKAAIERAAAEQNKARTIKDAEAEKERLKIVGEGEADRLAAVLVQIKANPDAMELRRLEALERIGDSGNMVVVSGENAQILLSPPGKTVKK